MLIDYIGKGQYAMTLHCRGQLPIVLEQSADPAELVFESGGWLQPGLRASVSEAAMTASLLCRGAKAPSEMLRFDPDLGGAIHVHLLSDDRTVERVAVVGYHYRAVSSHWVHEAFGAFILSSKPHAPGNEDKLDDETRGEGTGENAA